MNNPTFIEQYNKVTKAYMNNELKPLDSCACFIGNMLNNKSENWTFCREFNPLKNPNYSFILIPNLMEKEYNFYTSEEIYKLERNFLLMSYCGFFNSLTEESLFKAMESTLDMLKKIHESKGEIVEEYSFKKRELVKI